MTNPQTEEDRISYQALNWILLLLCAIIWGFSYFFIKHSLTGFEPNEVLTLRALAAGIALLPFLYAAFKKIPRHRFKYVLLCTLLGNGIPMYIYPLAQTHISSSVTGIINSLTPFCVYIIGIAFYGLKNTRLKLMGVILGLLGAVCLIVFRSQAELKADLFFLGVALMAPIMYGLNANILKKHLQGLPGLPLTAMMYFMLLVPAIPLFFYSGLPEKIQTNEAAQQALPYAMLLGILGTAVAMTLFNILLRRAHIMFATSVSYLMPVVAVILGLFDNETLGWHEITALVLILGGVVIINRVKE